MKLRDCSVFLAVILSSLGYGLFYQGAVAERDWNECMKKYDSQWGTQCKNCMFDRDTYRVTFTNICSEKVDAMCCIQEKYKNWKCYTTNELAPNDTMFGYACVGTGKYLYWVKRAGDHSVKFPRVDEVNGAYPD